MKELPIHCKRLLLRKASALALLVLLSACASPGRADFATGLGSASNYVLFGLSNTTIDATLTTVNGDVAVGQNATLSTQINTKIHGTVYKAPTATVTGPGTISGGIVT